MMKSSGKQLKLNLKVWPYEDVCVCVCECVCKLYGVYGRQREQTCQIHSEGSEREGAIS